MPGIPTNSIYSPASADFIKYYAPNQYCKLWGWVPADFAGRTDIPVVTFCHGGGWVSSTHYADDEYNKYDTITGELIVGAENQRSVPMDTNIADAFLAAGYAVVSVEFPMGFQEEATLQIWPASRFPVIPRMIGLSKQMLKTWGYLGSISVGGNVVNLSYSSDRYIGSGNSAGSIMETWVSFLLDGVLPYQRSDVGSHSISEWTPLFNHRVKGVINIDGICDFSRLANTGIISSQGIAYFGNHNRWPIAVSPVNRYASVPNWLKRAASFLPLIERNAPDNELVGLKAFSIGSPANGFAFNGFNSGGLALPAGTQPTTYVTKTTILDLFENTTGELIDPANPSAVANDVHDVSMFVKLEQVLQAQAAFNASDPALYDVWWGNDINNPTGNYGCTWSAGGSGGGAFQGNYLSRIPDFYATLVPWATTTLGITV